MFQASGDVDAAADKVDKLSVDDNQRDRSGRRNKNKKPEQPHYSAKKVTTPSGNADAVQRDGDVVGSKEGHNGGGVNVVVGKPPPARPSAAADDAKSDGGGSNTGTARRKNKNKNRAASDTNSVQDVQVRTKLRCCAVLSRATTRISC